MIVKKIFLYQYSLPFIFPLAIKGKNIKNREGLIIRLQSECGHEGLGEISPLANFSRESLDQAQKQIISMAVFLTHEHFPHDLEKLEGRFENYLGRFNLLPSVRFGIEMAILNLIASKKKVSLSDILSVEHQGSVRINGLLQGTKEDVVQQAKDLLAKGYTSMKLKVGSNIDEDIEKFNAVNEIVYGKVLLHLDANQAWDSEQAIEFGEKIGCASVDYIEEPFKDYKDIPEFFNKTLIPVALDETLLTTDINEIKSIDGVDFVVIKPTVIGGVEKTFHIVKEVQKVAINCVVSSSYETDLGIFTLASMAACSHRNVEAGLDTLKFLKTRLLIKPFDMNGGKISVDRLPINFDELDSSVLQPIPFK